MRKVGTVFLVVWAVLMTFVAGGLVGFEAMRLFGKSNLDSKSATSAPMLDQAGAEYSVDTTGKWQSDWVRYDGGVYDYNEDIITFLVMGIDKDDEVVKEVKEGVDGGQADALFLLVLNPHNESIKIIGINRNTMTDVDIYDEYGRYMTTMIAQIAVQHGFGNGMEESCEYQVKAVSNLFYQLPIHGYAAINMSAIPTINDMVGGVDVTVLEDLTKFDKKLVEGEQVHLEGQTAFHYVKSRDIKLYGSSDRRLERQRQYLNGFIRAAREASSENTNAAVQIFTEISDAMVTNISADEVSYLAPDMIKYSFDPTDFMMINGKTTRGEDLEEFYVDEDDLYRTIIEVFYEKVDNVD
ncbi:LCP family protein [Butyrivibrio sp.]|uniref:LCP family protein n=1 Tax=Butyrivibrio sp. TaxID=28121 RepID=UPI0025BD3C43|nr:LCP family protein [Butyrivibrio sp.]